MDLDEVLRTRGQAGNGVRPWTCEDEGNEIVRVDNCVVLCRLKGWRRWRTCAFRPRALLRAASEDSPAGPSSDAFARGCKSAGVSKDVPQDKSEHLHLCSGAATSVGTHKRSE